jgi:hypothetical protein
MQEVRIRFIINPKSRMLAGLPFRDANQTALTELDKNRTQSQRFSSIHDSIHGFSLSLSLSLSAKDAAQMKQDCRDFTHPVSCIDQSRSVITFVFSFSFFSPSREKKLHRRLFLQLLFLSRRRPHCCLKQLTSLYAAALTQHTEKVFLL